METYTVEYIANGLENMGVREQMLSLRGRESDLEFKFEGFTLAAFGGRDDKDSVWIYPRAKHGVGLDFEVNEGMSMSEMIEGCKSANQLTIGEVVDDEQLMCFDDAYDHLMRNLKYLTRQTGEYTKYFKDTEIKYLADQDSFLVKMEGFVIEMMYWDLYGIPKETSFYQKVIADVTLWELMILNAYIENQYEANK